MKILACGRWGGMGLLLDGCGGVRFTGGIDDDDGEVVGRNSTPDSVDDEEAAGLCMS